MQCWNCRREIAERAASCVFCEARQADHPLAEIAAIERQLEQPDLPAQERVRLEGELKQWRDSLELALEKMPPALHQELMDQARDSETAEEFLAGIFIGDCPTCGSAETQDCENVAGIEDVTVGRCKKCGAVFCPECGAVFANDKPTPATKKCPHCGSTDTSYDASQELPEDEEELAASFTLECYACGGEYCAFCGRPLAPAEEEE